eukprot:Sspe_Gene.37856::Locus_18259_Transcript_2_4_Confidence_0.333_Length_473::g.37856::m.37856
MSLKHREKISLMRTFSHALMRVLDDLEGQGCMIGRSSYFVCLRFTAKGRMRPLATRLWKRMLAHCCRPTTGHYNLLILSQGPLPDVDTALQILSKMREDKLKPDGFTWYALLSGCARGHNRSAARFIWRSMMDEGETP